MQCGGGAVGGSDSSAGPTGRGDEQEPGLPLTGQDGSPSPRQTACLTLELARPFEHESRLTVLLVRQRELLKQLDLDKDEAGNASLDGEAMRQAA